MTEPHDHPENEQRDLPVRRNGLLAALTVFGVWVIALYLYEGRVRLIDSPGAQGQLLFMFVPNILIGIGMTVLSYFFLIRAGFLQLFRIGMRGTRRSMVATILAIAVGLGVYATQAGDVTFPGTLRLFAGVLPIAIAHVLVCWGLLGASVESAVEERLGRRAMTVGMGAAAIAFAFSHLAHSPPFNQWETILFLVLPGIATGLVFFLIRDLYATILFHTFLGMSGLSVGAAVAGRLAPEYPVYLVAIVAAGLVLSAHVWLHRTSGEPVG